jgi:hypothetical protein
MNLYSLPENQKLIWDTISKVQKFQEMRKNDPKQCEVWFKDIIQTYYNKNQNTVINLNQLKVLNKDTIVFMLKTIKQQSNVQPISFKNNFENNMLSTSSTFSNSYSTIEPNSNETHNFISEQKQHKLNNDYQIRQQEYSNLFEKPKIQDIDFSEKNNEDKPIENIEELIKNQMAEREYDVQTIMNSNGNIDLGEENLDDEKNEKKNVTFSPEIIDEKSHIMKKIDNFMMEIMEKITNIQHEIEQIKTEQNIMKIKGENNKTETILSKMRSVEKNNKQDEQINKSINA